MPVIKPSTSTQLNLSPDPKPNQAPPPGWHEQIGSDGNMYWIKEPSAEEVKFNIQQPWFRPDTEELMDPNTGEWIKAPGMRPSKYRQVPLDNGLVQKEQWDDNLHTYNPVGSPEKANAGNINNLDEDLKTAQLNNLLNPREPRPPTANIWNVAPQTGIEQALALIGLRNSQANNNDVKSSELVPAQANQANARADYYGSGGVLDKRNNDTNVLGLAKEIATATGVMPTLSRDENGWLKMDTSGIPQNTLAAAAQAFDQKYKTGEQDINRAQVTGEFNGTPTLAAKVAESQQTGYFGGSPTLGRENQAFNQSEASAKFALNAQGQSFNQEDTLAKRAIDLSRNPRDYLAYAFGPGGVKPPAGTALADVLGRIGHTPNVSDALNNSSAYNQLRPITTPTAVGPPVQAPSAQAPTAPINLNPGNQSTTTSENVQAPTVVGGNTVVPGAGTPDISQWHNYPIPALKTIFSPAQLAMLPSEALQQFSNDDLLAIEKAKPGFLANLYTTLPEGQRKQQLAQIPGNWMPLNGQQTGGATQQVPAPQAPVQSGTKFSLASASPTQTPQVQSVPDGNYGPGGNPSGAGYQGGAPAGADGAGNWRIQPAQQPKQLILPGGDNVSSLDDLRGVGVLPSRIDSAIQGGNNLQAPLYGGFKQINASTINAMNPSDLEALKGTLDFTGNNADDFLAQSQRQASTGFNIGTANRAPQVRLA